MQAEYLNQGADEPNASFFNTLVRTVWRAASSLKFDLVVSVSFCMSK